MLLSEGETVLSWSLLILHFYAYVLDMCAVFAFILFVCLTVASFSPHFFKSDTAYQVIQIFLWL